MNMTHKEMQALRTRADTLRIHVSIGEDGLTNAVWDKIELELSEHELIKIGVSIEDKVERMQLAAKICQRSHARFIRSDDDGIAIFRSNH